MNWWQIALAAYVIGALATGFFNLRILVYVSNPFIVLRNALLWPFFLPILIMLWSEEL